MSPRSIFSILMFIIGVAVMLIQLWFEVWTSQVFIKLMITISAFFVVSVVVNFVGREAQATRNLENGHEKDH